MALAIVPLDRNSGIPCPEQPAPSDTIFDIEDIPFDIPIPTDPTDDLDALSTELEESEGLSPIEARSQALALTDELAAFASVWDTDVFMAGNVMASPTIVPIDPVPDYVQQPLAA